MDCIPKWHTIAFQEWFFKKMEILCSFKMTAKHFLKQMDEKNFCRKIVYKCAPINHTDYTEYAHHHGLDTDGTVSYPLPQNFWEFDRLDEFNNDAGNWKFKFQWEFRTGQMAEVVWFQASFKNILLTQIFSSDFFKLFEGF